MPQLNPSPWFLIFIMSWLIYLTLMYKANLKTLNEPLMQNINMSELKSWDWLWI